ncbi:MAG: prolyl oligopeptidase family serine peptidase [bacterium]|nr:prolyl oligopeptidase family serine peptidase [bacterium]
MNKSSRYIKVSLAAAMGMIALLMGLAWFFSSMALYPNTWCDKEHYLYCGDPSETGLSFSDAAFTTSDGVKLEGWFIPAAGSKKGIVLVHGHGGTIHEGMRYTTSLRKAGFNLLLFHLRGNMKDPEKSFYSMGFHEKKDIFAAVDYLYKKKEMASVGVFGFSMGSTTAVLAMAEDKRIKAGIFNSAYADIYDQFTEAAKRDFNLPRFPLVHLGMWIAELRGDIDFNEVRPEKKIASIAPRPVFIMHCDKDGLIDFSHGKRMFAAAKEPKEFWAVPGCRHVRAWNIGREEAEARVTEFFKKNL